MSRLSSTYLRLLVLLTALLLCISPVISSPSPTYGRDDKNHDKTVRVKKGESIQKAIDHAKPYTRIEVEGEHREQVVITKDGISLVGKNAKLTPPHPYDKKNPCYGLIQDDAGANTSVGICIYGKGVKLAPTYVPALFHWKVESVRDRVKDVSVTGFEVSGFNGANIANYGGKRTSISHNKLAGGLRYGFLTAGSTNTKASDNKVSGAGTTTLNRVVGVGGPIAMCMDDVSSAEFSDNNIEGYFIGLCTETSNGVNKGNKIRKCCLGNVLDPGVNEARSLNNDIRDWDKRCADDSAAGISILGATNSLVKGNKISIGFTGLTPPLGGAGLFMGDIFPGFANVGNKVVENWFGENDADIFNISPGPNTIKNNKCDVAFKGTPPALEAAPEYCR